MTRSKIIIAAVIATLAGIGQSANAVPVAADLMGGGSQNLVSYSNAWTNAFSSSSDGFQTYQRGSGPIPGRLLDNSATSSDSFGIIDQDNRDPFFGIVDTRNNNTSGAVTATWVFDISGFEDLSLSIDMGAMGNFETNDTLNFSYSIDGGMSSTAFSSSVDTAGSQTYTLAGGATNTLDDPMFVNGTMLSNELQTLSTDLIGAGAFLTLTLTADFNGGADVAAFQHIIIAGRAMTIVVAEPATLAVLGLGLVLVGGLRRRR